LTKRSSGATNDFTQMHRAVATRNHRAMVEYVENSGRFAPGLIEMLSVVKKEVENLRFHDEHSPFEQ